MVPNGSNAPTLHDRQRADLLKANLLHQLDAAGALGLSCNVLVVGARIQIDFDNDGEHFQINAGLETVESAIRQLSRQNLVQPIRVIGVAGKHQITDEGQHWLEHS